MEISFGKEITGQPPILDSEYKKLFLSGAVKEIDGRFFVVFKKQVIEFKLATFGYEIIDVRKVPCAKYHLPEILPGMNQAQKEAVYVERKRLTQRKPLSRKNFDVYEKHPKLQCG